MLALLAEIFGWIATVFRGAGMFSKNAKTVKVLVSIGNFGWMCSGILTKNIPLIVSNLLCLVVFAFEALTQKKEEDDK